MKVLLDTHAFIWWDSDAEKLPSGVIAVCQDPSNTIVLSVASIWEMLIKSQLGKLSLRRPIAELIESQRVTNQIQVLPITLEHVLALESLPNYHRDPFDRLLIAQAIIETASLVSNDPLLARYPVSLLW